MGQSHSGVGCQGTGQFIGSTVRPLRNSIHSACRRHEEKQLESVGIPEQIIWFDLAVCTFNPNQAQLYTYCILQLPGKLYCRTPSKRNGTLHSQQIYLYPLLSNMEWSAK